MTSKADVNPSAAMIHARREAGPPLSALASVSACGIGNPPSSSASFPGFGRVPTRLPARPNVHISYIFRPIRQREGPDMQRSITITMAAVLAVALGGCGNNSDPEPAKPAAPAKPATYKQQVIDCVEGVAFKVDAADSSNLRVNSGGGDGVALIAVLESERAAQRFHAQLAVEGVYGGRGVATWLPAASDARKRVIGDCLTP